MLSRLLILSAALATLPIVAEAQMFTNLTPDSDRILSDPNYLPLTGEIWGSTEYSHTFSGGSTFNAGAQTGWFHGDSNNIDQYFGYGVTDDLTLDASIAYDPNNDRTFHSAASGATTTLTSTGFADPTFGATYRVLDQRNYPVTLDVFGSYTPDAFDAKAPSVGEDGLVASGGQSGRVGAALAEEYQQFTVRGAFAANFLGQRSIEDVTSGGQLYQGMHTEYDLSLQTQTRLTDLFSVNAGFDYTINHSTALNNTGSGVTGFDHPGNAAALNASLNYNFVPNTVVGSLLYQYDIGSNASTDLSDATADTETHNHGSNLLGVKLDYVLP